MASNATNEEWLLVSRPDAFVSEANFRKQPTSIPQPKEGEVLLRSLFISVDPYMRGRMNEGKSYFGNFPLGEPVTGNIIARVEESRAASLGVGQLVLVFGPWKRLFTFPAEKARAIDTSLAPPQAFLGILGLTGLSAYFPIRDIAKPKPGDVAFVSAAAGGVGSAAGQILKIMGCHKVIGSAGSEEKCAAIKGLGFDHAFNYKTRSAADALSEFAPEGLDIYFDNVGGETLDDTLLHMKAGGRIVLCGAISQYNKPKDQVYGIKNLPAMIGKQSKLQGFLVSAWSNEFPAAINQLGTWLREGKLQNRETVIQGFDKLPQAVVTLFNGGNVGKLVVDVSE